MHNNVVWKPTSLDPTKLPSGSLRVSQRANNWASSFMSQTAGHLARPPTAQPGNYPPFRDGPRPNNTKWELALAQVRSNLISSSYCCGKLVLPTLVQQLWEAMGALWIDFIWMYHKLIWFSGWKKERWQRLISVFMARINPLSALKCVKFITANISIAHPDPRVRLQSHSEGSPDSLSPNHWKSNE